MNYPDYLSIGNWLFRYLKKDEFETRPVGGPIPENLYISLSRWRAMDLSKDLSIVCSKRKLPLARRTI